MGPRPKVKQIKSLRKGFGSKPNNKEKVKKRKPKENLNGPRHKLNKRKRNKKRLTGLSSKGEYLSLKDVLLMSKSDLNLVVLVSSSSSYILGDAPLMGKSGLNLVVLVPPSSG